MSFKCPDCGLIHGASCPAESSDSREIWIMINSGDLTAGEFLDKIVELAESLNMTIGAGINSKGGDK